MRVKFWGVRGSIPCPGSQTVKYGGNTSCIELRFDEIDRLIIIDAGSGIRELGNYIMANDLPKGAIETDLFLSHTHWDHIMGFPFFVPLYLPTTKIRVHGPVTHEADTLETIVGGQMTYRYFPVRDVELSAQIEYDHLKEGRFDLGDGITLVTKYLNHPILCLGYRFEYKGKVFCTSYDTEPYTNIFCTDPDDPSYDEAMAIEGEAVAGEQNKLLDTFLAGADLVVFDTQYTQAEYEDSKIGWGHSPMEYAVQTANRCGIKKMAMFHHEPMRTDDQMDALVGKHCSAGKNGTPEIFFAREGMEITL